MEEKIKKDIIYIDIDDDITDIVGKVKNSKEKIIAIVPPKGVGVLRSSVNLRLLARTSSKIGKRIVLITNNPSLVTMAAGASIPVAKTLQSKPEVPEIDVLEVDGDDIIDGETLPVAEFAGKTQDEKEAEMLENLDIDDNKSFARKEPEVARESRKKAAPALKVPNFNAFRKKIFIFGGLGVVALIFFIWAIFFAPAAEVIISAKTSDLNISEKLSLSGSASQVDASKNILPLKTEVIEKVEEVKFEATGTKVDGETAIGTLSLSQSSESEGYSIKAGTAFSSGSCNFVTLEGASVSGFGVSISGGRISAGLGRGSVKVRATQIGEQCNLEAGASFTSAISGLNATASGNFSGGSKKTIKVVSEDDVNNVRKKLSENKNDNARKELLAKFDNGFKIIEDSYGVETGEIELSPNVGQEASNGASAKVKSRYKISAISKKHLEEYLKNFAANKIDEKNQQVYGEDFDKFEITNFNAENSQIQLSSTIKIGPKINESELKNEIKGKVLGEVQSKIESVEGVKSVDVRFSHFWVNKIPSDDQKIKIKFTVE